MALPFPEGAFDVVLCLHGLQFFPDRAGQGDFRRLPGILDTNGTLGGESYRDLQHDLVVGHPG